MPIHRFRGVAPELAAIWCPNHLPGTLTEA
jgi:hypothetical protein